MPGTQTSVQVRTKRDNAQTLQTKVAHLEALFELAGTVSRAEQPAEIYEAATRCLVQTVKADRASVLIFDPDGVIRFKAWIGLSAEYRAAVEGHTPWQYGARDAEPIAVADVQQEPTLVNYQSIFAREGIAAVAFIPLIAKGGLLGKFMLYYNAPHEFQREEIHVAQAAATHVAYAAERQFAEAALRDSQERFRAVFTQAGVGISQIGLKGEWALINDRFCSVLGYTQEELRHKTFLDVTHPDDRAASLAEIRQLMTDNQPSRTWEKRYIRKDGAVVWARLCVALVRDAEGLPQYLIAVVEDITQQVFAENRLRDVERRFNLAQRAAGLGLWESDLRTGVITVSAEYARIHGLEQDRITLTRADWLSRVHAEDRTYVEERLTAGLQSGSWDEEFRVVWPDGSVHWLMGKGQVFRDDSGEPVRIAGLSLDITARKQAEMALRESEERFRNMADNAPVMIWIIGPDGLCTFFSKRWLDFTGRPLEKELGFGWLEGVHPDDLKECAETFNAAFDSRRNFQMEQRVRRADGEYRSLLCTGVPRFTEDHVFAGYVGCSIDMTDHKRTQEQALAAQKLESLGVLAGGVAHDFNNLLGSILADAELLLDSFGAKDPSRDGVERIRTVAIRAAEIVRELLTYAGRESSGFEPVDLSRLTAEMLQLLKVSISKRAVLNVSLPENLPAVRANAALLRQVILNLITNASEALEERDGAITIGLSMLPAGREVLFNEGRHLRLTVSDNGVGMTKEVQARIFDPFFSTKFAGRGLGLAAVQGIIRSHGGAIQVFSQPGLGSRFEVTLPCTDLSAAVAAPAGSEPERSNPAGTVLVVEDEDMLRLAVTKMLRRSGFHVIEACDGLAAAELIRLNQTKIDVILLDMTLPGMSGREVFEEVRRTRPTMKVILTTAYSQDMARTAVGGEQPWQFIRKPYRLVDLINLLRATFRQA